jgi:hypothetical protein
MDSVSRCRGTVSRTTRSSDWLISFPLSLSAYSAHSPAPTLTTSQVEWLAKYLRGWCTSTTNDVIILERMYQVPTYKSIVRM